MSLERLLERQLERLPVLATIALVRVGFSIAVIPQRRHQGEPHGPGTTLTKHKWRNWISVEWLQRHVSQGAEGGLAGGPFLSLDSKGQQARTVWLWPQLPDRSRTPCRHRRR